jgi:membrane protease YdiL (CAAX protease family)
MRAGASALAAGAHVAAAVGAIPAAYALRNFQRMTLRPLLLCLAMPGALGVAMMIAGGIVSGNFVHRLLLERLTIGIDSLLLYVPLVFVFEEVSFRGAFDSHLQYRDEAGGWASAIWLSVLWGLWHVPVTRTMAPLPGLIVNNVIVCCVIGVPFSFFWRRSGNLFVTGWTHAVVDAVRNSFLVLPFR